MKLVVLVVEDEPPVREAVLADLAEPARVVRLEAAEDVEDAWEVVGEVDEDGDVLALVLADHRLPGRTGVDMLVEMMDDARTAAARKVLVTGQAGDGEEALALWKATQPDICLLDLRMPRLDGRATGGRSHHRGDHSAAA